MRKCLAVLILLCGIPSLIGQREKLSNEPLSEAEAKKLILRTAGMVNGNAWVHAWGENEKAHWMIGFTEGLLAQSVLSDCSRCPDVWPKGDPSLRAMIAELDSFYATKENRLIPMAQVLVFISRRFDGKFTEAEWEREVQVLRKISQPAKPTGQVP